MIDEKKIEEAAERYLLNVFNENVIGDADFKEYIRAFKAGINWFLENLWHDASEEPKGGYDILIECLNGAYTEYGAYRHSSAQLWNDFVDRSHTTRWLYIEDLMKGGK